MSAGYTPAINLACHTGAKVAYDPTIAMHRATDLPAGVHVAGSVAGIWSKPLPAIMASRSDVRRRWRPLAGYRSARGGGRRKGKGYYLSLANHRIPRRQGFHRFRRRFAHARHHDSVHDGYDDIQSSSATPPPGLAPARGRHAIQHHTHGGAGHRPRYPEGRHHEFRPPLVPEKFGHLAGRGYEPTRPRQCTTGTWRWAPA